MASKRSCDPIDPTMAPSLSKSGCPDKRIWHYTKDGLYSVRSGYYVAMEMMQNGEFGRKGEGDVKLRWINGRNVEENLVSIGAEQDPVIYFEDL
ncbi:hypothetical protein ACFX2I_001208 [Malus domestica]